jgi:superfamily II DNA or RNA helicase
MHIYMYTHPFVKYFFRPYPTAKAVPAAGIFECRKVHPMSIPATMQDYLRHFSKELGERIVEMCPALHTPDDPVSPRMKTLLRKPYRAQELAAMGVVRRWQRARAAAVTGECGTGKTLVALAAVHCHAEGRPYTALAIVPGHLTAKMARETFQTLPRVRVFFIDALRDGARNGSPCGVNEVKLRHGKIVREGFHTTLTDLRLRKNHRTARLRWQQEICSGPALFIVGRDRSKLGWFWRHAYEVAQCGRYQGSVVNPDTGCPVYVGDERLLASDFNKIRLSEIIGGHGKDEDNTNTKSRRSLYSPLWQADGQRIRRVAPMEFIGRYLADWFDYGIGDEVHQLTAGDTAQGNALGTLAACTDRLVVLTGTLLSGYADDLYHLLFRLEAGKMAGLGYQWGEAGVRCFAEKYGVLEKITTIQPADNACSKARVTTQVKRRPGASPLMFGHFLMELGAFISLEDISCDLPTYTEEVIGVAMDPPLRETYRQLEEDIKRALKEHRGNHSVMSVGLNALLMYPDRPYEVGELWGWEFNEETGRREKFLIGRAEDLDRECLQAKERRLLDIVQRELGAGRRCHIYAVYTRSRDVTHRLAGILAREGIQVAVLTSDVAPEKREAWFERKLEEKVQVTISHPKIIETGLDLLCHPTLIFYESGYSLHTLRQASRRSWRIGQWQPVRVYYLHYEDTVQTACLRLMGKKLLVSLALEGKFSGEGLQALDDGDDMLTAMARELVTERGIGEPAAVVWRQLQVRRGEMSRRTSSEMQEEEANAETPVVNERGPEVNEQPAPEGVPYLVFGMPHGRPSNRKLSRRTMPVELVNQLTLFSEPSG